MLTFNDLGLIEEFEKERKEQQKRTFPTVQMLNF